MLAIMSYDRSNIEKKTTPIEKRDRDFFKWGALDIINSVCEYMNCSHTEWEFDFETIKTIKLYKYIFKFHFYDPDEYKYEVRKFVHYDSRSTTGKIQPKAIAIYCIYTGHAKMQDDIDALFQKDNNEYCNYFTQSLIILDKK
jgi:hypothetical protein